MEIGQVATVIRWIARIASVGSLLLLAAFAFGPGERGNATAREWIALAFFPIGVGLGMLVAWRHELIGSLISLGSLGAFYLMFGLVRGSVPKGPYFLLFTAPAVLFLIAALLSRGSRIR